MKKVFLLLTLTLLLCSCATMFTGSKKRVTFDSNIDQPATLTIDGRKHADITFPYSAKVKRGFNETIVKAESQGYQPTQIVIDKNFNAVSILNLFGILGWGIDAATGAMMKPEFNGYEFEFIKIPTSNPEISQK